jgi:polyribonucleotide nucleotidyltransferase
VDNVEDVLKVGDHVNVKLVDVDKKTGKFKLSHRVLTPKPEGYVEPKPQRPSKPHAPRPNQPESND